MLCYVRPGFTHQIFSVDGSNGVCDHVIVASDVHVLGDGDFSCALWGMMVSYGGRCVLLELASFFCYYFYFYYYVYYY